MGNLSQKNIAEDVVSINLPKISKSDNPKVLSLFNDNLQYPESGMIAISQECIQTKILSFSSSFYSSLFPLPYLFYLFFDLPLFPPSSLFFF